MDDTLMLGVLLSVGFLIVFVLIWLLITTLIVRWSGWANLQESFSDQPRDRLVEKWSMTTGSMGRGLRTGAHFRNCLILEVCQSGLRLRLWRIFAPFAGSIFVPWGQIRTEGGIMGTTLLLFGQPEIGCLRIRSKLAQKIEAVMPRYFTMPKD